MKSNLVPGDLIRFQLKRRDINTKILLGVVLEVSARNFIRVYSVNREYQLCSYDFIERIS